MTLNIMFVAYLHKYIIYCYNKCVMCAQDSHWSTATTAISCRPARNVLTAFYFLTILPTLLACILARKTT